jgi:acyl-CoA synthetase (AMP-forming)/AMP-acid ligase II
MTELALKPVSIAEVLRRRAAQAPEALAFRFLLDGEDKSVSITYGNLDEQARAIAAELQLRTSPHDRVLLVYGPGLEFIAAFMGCVYAGVVPVPAYPPRRIRSVDGWLPLIRIATNCQSRLILTGGSLAPLIAKNLPAVRALAEVECLLTDAPTTAVSRWNAPSVDENDLALLQYTSGSTAEPKGVMVTHRALMHNQRLIQEAFEHTEGARGVSWLPLYHDMGLIGSVLQMIYVGGSCVLMSPFAFLQRPVRWLRAISKYSAHTSPAPNFAFDYCAKWVTLEEKIGLDLSTWTIAAVGAEPIRAATLRRFADSFADCGFRAEALYPCYGLAESTLFVTGGQKGGGARITKRDAVIGDTRQIRSGAIAPLDAVEIVSCGRTWLEQEVRIVDPQSLIPLPDDTVGEIWVRGPSVGQGYWDHPEETARTFQAYLPSSGEGPFLRTGDLGFLRDRELFVTGRIKDLLIVRGRNFYPHDIEETVQSAHSACRLGFGAVFQSDSPDGPRLVIVQEVERGCRQVDAAEVRETIREAVIEAHELAPDDIKLVEPGSIPVTTSGKIQRFLCRIECECGTLPVWKGNSP